MTYLSKRTFYNVLYIYMSIILPLLLSLLGLLLSDVWRLPLLRLPNWGRSFSRSCVLHVASEKLKRCVYICTYTYSPYVHIYHIYVCACIYVYIYTHHMNIRMMEPIIYIYIYMICLRFVCCNVAIFLHLCSRSSLRAASPAMPLWIASWVLASSVCIFISCVLWAASRATGYWWTGNKQQVIRQ